jgi:hypothetical protein
VHGGEVKRRAAGWVIALLALFIVLAIVGIDDPDLDQAAYCMNVADGTWPDYLGTYKDECGGTEPPKFNENFTK